MSRHPFDGDFRITPAQKVQFQRDGFVKLRGFLNPNVVRMLRAREIEPAVISAFRAKEQAGVRTNVGEFWAVRTGILNSPAMTEILENHQVEDDFEPGDVLLFNKLVVHRSIMLGEGNLPRRAAYVLRFVDAGSHYDLQRAQDLEFPVEQYGKGLFPYKGFTRQHIEIAEAGAADGDLLAECAYFKDRERRLVRRQPSADAA